MAMQSVPTTKPTPTCLPFDQVCRAGELVEMLKAITDLMACASMSEQQPLMDSIPMGAHAAREMLKELQSITELHVAAEVEG